MNVIELNVGGVVYSTTLSTLNRDRGSYISEYFIRTVGRVTSVNETNGVKLDEFAERVSKMDDKRYFIDRDGDLFRYILDYLRTGKLVLPEKFSELKRLREEIKFYRLNGLLKQMPVGLMPKQDSVTTGLKYVDPTIGENGHITVGYRGTFGGKDGQADVKFRKINRILVCGRYQLCREVFGDTLNESRDPDRGGDGRYTSRLFLKHTFLEQAFDMLAARSFKLCSACASGTAGGQDLLSRNGGNDSEEQRWSHFNEFIFYRGP